MNPPERGVFRLDKTFYLWGDVFSWSNKKLFNIKILFIT